MGITTQMNLSSAESAEYLRSSLLGLLEYVPYWLVPRHAHGPGCGNPTNPTPFWNGDLDIKSGISGSKSQQAVGWGVG